MKLNRVIALAVGLASCGLSVAQAKSLRDAGQPAEFPPPTYMGRQYVDSQGCVFIRAGIDGNVSWVPRVSRSRKVICGQTPTLGRAAPQVAVAKAAPAPVATPARAPQPSQTATAKQTVRAAAPAVQPVYRSASASGAVTGRKLTTTRAATGAAPAPRRSGCRGASPISDRYVGKSAGVRCGPQTAPHVTSRSGGVLTRRAPTAPVYVAGGYAPSSDVTRSYAAGRAQARPAPGTVITAKEIKTVDPQIRVVPRHVYKKQAQGQQGIFVPDGYKRVWMDDRLNPHRAHQTFAGKTNMELVWTRTTPRRLVERATGRVVTHEYPGLSYPYTSYGAQNEAQIGASAAAPVISSQGQRTSRLSTRSDAQRKTGQVVSYRYVQAGTFSSRAGAERVASQLARMGLPTRLSRISSNGKRYSLVMAGPFNSQAAVNTALGRVRAAGFSDAMLRN